MHEVSDGTPGGYGWDELLDIAASRCAGGPIRAMFLPRAVPQTVALWRPRRSPALTGKPGMVNRGKIAELYHPDWVARDGGLALAERRSALRQGLPETWHGTARPDGCLGQARHR